MEKKDVFMFLIEHSKQYCREKTFLKKFPQVCKRDCVSKINYENKLRMICKFLKV